MSTERDDNSVERSDDSVAGTAHRFDEEAEPVRGRPARRSRVTAGAVAAAVLLAGVGGAYWAANAAGGSGGKAARATPAALRLGDPAVPAQSVTGGGVTYQLTGSLPAGPKSAAVYRPAAEVSAAQVERLAALLGVGGPAVSDGTAWHVGPTTGAGPALLVSRAAPGNWSYTGGGPAAVPVRPPAPPSPPTDPASPAGPADPAGSPVSAPKAEAVATAVLDGLGLSGAARIDAAQTIGPERLVTADPVVGGLPTTGWRTELDVGPNGALTRASGRLSALAKGATYPVVSAQAAFQRLAAGSPTPPDHGVSSCLVPLVPPTPAVPAAPSGPGTDKKLPRTLPCVPGNGHPTQVRGAVFGLSSAVVSGTQTLIPCWLFDTAPAGVSNTSVVAEPAVDPAFLQTPGGPSGGPGTASPGGPPPVPPTAPIDPGGPKLPGGPAKPPVPARPGDPAPTAPAAPAQDVKVTGYHADGSTLDVTFSGGLCSTYRAVAAETGTEVRVTVTQASDGKHRMCPMIVRDFTRTVDLQRPLGSRTVVDTSDGQPIRGQ
ncbi:hypothetical protein GA0115240_176017 [Streptomyces sp. DvalAA-14]|uniref:hypothetical protein n=1 Tax=unclassified Streptomyces TaxID=2593676 RepID=UPI00081B9A16|nr:MULTISPECIES: hypothetical protein [unclassified Streptomyces]MYS25198.1 hypothetical protein [Streptomyces sp. SID4948]SCE52873.1 hypothetical protein GA0115240_176017 [Streptomyces sp. DvalAA-14]